MPRTRNAANPYSIVRSTYGSAVKMLNSAIAFQLGTSVYPFVVVSYRRVSCSEIESPAWSYGGYRRARSCDASPASRRRMSVDVYHSVVVIARPLRFYKLEKIFLVDTTRTTS